MTNQYMMQYLMGVSMGNPYEFIYTMIYHARRSQIQFLKDIFHCNVDVDQKVYIDLISKSKYIATPCINMVIE